MKINFSNPRFNLVSQLLPAKSCQQLCSFAKKYIPDSFTPSLSLAEKPTNRFIHKFYSILKPIENITAESYANLSKWKINKLRKATPKRLLELAQTNCNLAKKIKSNLDKEYGKNNYTVISVGRSVSSVTETLKDLGVNVKFLPLSNMKINFQATSKGIDEYKKYLETIGFTPEKLSKNPSHKYILFDFAVSGNTLRYLKHTLNDVFGFWQNPNLITKEINQYTSKPLQDLFYHERFKNFSPVGKLKPREFENVFMQANADTAVEYKSEMAKNIRKLFRFCVLDNLKENNNINPTRELTAIKRYETVSYVDRLAKKRMKEFFKNLNTQKTN